MGSTRATRWRRPALSVVAALVGLAACAGCHRESAVAPPPEGILFVSIDTTRADHVSAYGYQRPTTPTLAKLAADGVRFANVYCAMPTTDPSHATMLTGLYPRSHGIMRNAARATGPKRPSLASVLRQHGYTTASITARLGLDPKLMRIAGFDETDAPRLPAKWRTAGEIVDKATRWLTAHDGERWFLWVHLWEPHKPYEPTEPERSRFLDPATDPRFVEEDPPRFLRRGARVPDEVVAAARSLYDAEIAIADGAVARIVAAARAAVRTPSALLINVVADHGEALGERQASRRIAFGHGTLVYDEVVKVPWIVVREGVIGPGVIHTPVSLVDVAATLIALVDPATSFGGEGRSLADSVLSGREPDPAPIVVERRLFASPPTPELGYAELAWIDYPWKIIANEGAKTPELYRLDTDPGELRDLATVEPEQLRRLRGALDAWKQRHPLPERGVAATHARGAARRGGDEAGKAERQEREALRSLGYID